MSSATSKRRRLSSPSPGAAEPEGEGPNLISQLSDCVLCSILSFLPAKDSARTSVLSSRWRHLWKVAPLRLDNSSLCSDEQLVSRIFDSHHGPIESLTLSGFTQAAMDRFVESAVQKGTRELTLIGRCYQLPPSLLCCNSLHQLSLVSYRFPKALPPSMFPNIRELKLTAVPLPNDLLSKCGSLETLHLICAAGFEDSPCYLHQFAKAPQAFFCWEVFFTAKTVNH